MNAVSGMNCSSYLRHPRISSNSNKVDNSSHVSGSSQSLDCPPWYEEKNNVCVPGDGFTEVVLIQPGTKQPLLLPFYCMTTTDNLTDRRDVIGGCLFTTNTPKLMRFFPLPCKISELNRFMCADLNRQGQLCGKCADGYAPAVYSYVLECVNCTNYGSYNWFKYSAIAFGPLTLFCVIIIAFHVSATSPYFHGYILFCQLVSLPTILRLFVTSHEYEYYQNTKWFIYVYTCLVGVWNLDFFRLIYEPFCLHPRMTVVQTLLLDYCIAFYPLFLLVLTYSLAAMYNRNCKIIVLLWKPFRRVLRPLSQDLDIQTTLIESFSTLYLLSVIKIQSVSMDLLLPTTLYYPNGKKKGYYLYLAGDVLYFGPHHLPYALLALLLLVIFVLLPIMLLLLYPCRFFQRLLNAMNCNSQGLRTYMDVFQGHYKDGTQNTKDFRYFSGVFLIIRMFVVAQFPLLNSYSSVVIVGLCITVLTFTVTILHPQRTRTHYILDSVFLSLLSLMLFSAIADVMGVHNTLPSQILRGLGIVSCLSPLGYATVLTLYWILRKKRIPQRVLSGIRKRVVGGLIIHEQYTALVCSTDYNTM